MDPTLKTNVMSKVCNIEMGTGNFYVGPCNKNNSFSLRLLRIKLCVGTYYLLPFVPRRYM